MAIPKYVRLDNDDRQIALGMVAELHILVAKRDAAKKLMDEAKAHGWSAALLHYSMLFNQYNEESMAVQAAATKFATDNNMK